MTNTAKTQQSATTSKYENIIATLSILGIGCYLVLRYALDIGHEVYTLAVNAALTSAIASLYQGQFSFSIALVQLPLLAVLALGGIPSGLSAHRKIIPGRFWCRFAGRPIHSHRGFAG